MTILKYKNSNERYFLVSFHTQIFNNAQDNASEGMKVYLGLTSEGLSAPENTYRGREDFSSHILKQAIIANTP
jgi:archaeosine synthase beta-subunit